jgi:hypothetical protein
LLVITRLALDVSPAAGGRGAAHTGWNTFIAAASAGGRCAGLREGRLAGARWARPGRPRSGGEMTRWRAGAGACEVRLWGARAGPPVRRDWYPRRAV